MEIEILKKAGLTESQAKGYMALIENGEKSPAELSELINETRTNTYAIVDRLEKLGLAKKKDNTNKAVYVAAHPSAVELLAEKRRKIVTKNEREIKQNLSSLINLFYEHNELPGTRTLNGIDGIKTVHKETLNDKKDIYLLRTTADTTNLSLDYWNDYRKKRSELGINTYAITPKTELSIKVQEEDKKMLFHRTFIDENDYTAPVEIDIYGDKVALIAFGETQIATIINSPPIAESLRQVFKLVSKSINNKSN